MQALSSGRDSPPTAQAQVFATATVYENVVKS